VNGLDTAILVVVGLSALLGAIRGMLTEVLSLLVWVAALWLTIAVGDRVAAEFTGIATPLLRSLAGHGATFVLVLVLGNLLVWLLRALLHGAGLSGTDRLLGFGFGAARGYAIVLAVVLLVSFTPWSRAGLWRDSALMPLFTYPAGWIVAQLPDTSTLIDFARPALPTLPAAGTGTDAASIGGAPAQIGGVDLAQAAQWVGMVPQDGFPLLREWAAASGLAPVAGGPGDASAGDPARIGASTAAGDPARVGAPADGATPGDPANTQHPNPESN
jgi:membrane protein required for colicin V production